MNEKMKSLMENEELMTALVEAETPEELGKVFEDSGITLEDGMTVEEAFRIVKAQKDAELDEDVLEDVSGGMVGTIILAVGACTLASAELAFLGGYAYQTYQNYKESKNKKKGKKNGK